MRVHRVQVSSPLPEALEPLARLARNSWYSWHPEVGELFAQIDADAWKRSLERPVVALALMSHDALLAAADDRRFLGALQRVADRLSDETRAPNAQPDGAEGISIAYFSCEFGLDQGLPIYSGGLGLLSGDHLKSASDLKLPFVAVGLFYRRGYFRQALAPDGWQLEWYPDNEPAALPVSRALNSNGQPVRVSVTLAGSVVHARVWRADAGRVPLYLLDTDVPENPAPLRSITDALYGGDREHRIQQELVLGIGGMRALRALGHAPSVFHMNEGHSAFLAVERLRILMAEENLPLESALEVTRASTVFTTHTPVPAGNEVFESDLVERYVGPLVNDLGVSWETFTALGRIPGSGDDRIGMTVLALQTAGRANGVSKLHGVVSRDMWRGLWPGRPASEVPIGAVTNGVHTWSWVGPEMRALIAEYCGPAPFDDPGDPASWAGVAGIPDRRLWDVRCAARARLLTHAAQAGTPGSLDPDALTIGFSRRFAAYKRAGLLLRQPERLIALLKAADRPVQIVMAGKAHPQDDPGKEIIRQIVQFARDPRLDGKLVFLPDYDIETAKYLVQGADIWLNTPRRPLEASGTSGMKAAVNGVLNVSVLDGWWAEGYTSDVGWAIGDDEVFDDAEAQDARDADALFAILEQSVIPTFYRRSDEDLPERWLKMMRASIAELGPEYSTHRMVRAYAERYYAPAHHDGQLLSRDGFAAAKAAARLRGKLTAAWPATRISSTEAIGEAATTTAPHAVSFAVSLDGLSPQDVVVEVVSGLIDEAGVLIPDAVTTASHDRSSGGVHHYSAAVSFASGGRNGLAGRVVPRQPDGVPSPLPFLRWEEMPNGHVTT